MKTHAKQPPVRSLLTCLVLLAAALHSFGDCIEAFPGLVSWWRAEGNAIDTRATNNGTLLNGVSFSEGRVGQAFTFNGSNSYVEIPNSPGLVLTNELTIEFWVKRLRVDYATSEYILEKGGDWLYGAQNYAVALHNGEHNYALHFLFAGGWRGGGSIADTNWHHCAVVARNGDADPVLYIDGVSQALTYREGAAAINLFPSQLPLHLGAQLDPISGWFYYGNTVLDEISFYDRALSAEEIQAIFNAGAAGKCLPASPTKCVPASSNLVAWWRGQGNVINAVDSSSSSNSGTSFAPGQVGDGFLFNGTNSFIEVPDSPGLRLTNELTIECWVRRLRLDSPTGPSTEYILEKGGDWTAGQQNYAVALHNGSYGYCLHFLFAGGWRGGGSIGDTNWHHCAVVARNGEADPSLYIDGQPQTIIYREGNSTITLPPTPRPLHIGAQVDPISGWVYFGKTMIDELSIYDHALTGEEIAAVFNAGASGKCISFPNPVLSLDVSPPNMTLSWPTWAGNFLSARNLRSALKLDVLVQLPFLSNDK